MEEGLPGYFSYVFNTVKNASINVQIHFTAREQGMKN